ncbi:hypothetical protein ACVWXL_005892 [Bradyrhizobium sp. GM22.5]
MSDNLPDDPETLKAMLLAALHESERLRQIIKELQRHRFGRKAHFADGERRFQAIVSSCFARW